MTTRRDFLVKTAAVGISAAVSAPTARGSAANVFAKNSGSIEGLRIKSAIRRDDTIRRYAGTGDCWHMSWAMDDMQYVSLCDGFGFTGQSRFAYNCRMFSIEGRPENSRFHDLPGYPQLAYYPSQKLAHTRYYPFGTLAIDGRLYQFMSTFNRGLVHGDMTDDMVKVGRSNPLRFTGVKLIYSPDNGRTWCNQNGSTPVVWEDWNHRSRDTMVFLNEPNEAFSLLSVLQMGKNYEHNRDGYVYVYSPNGNVDGLMNELVMLRAPKGKLLDRSTYEYFAGLQRTEAKWSREIAARQPAHTFPRGWVSTFLHPYAWLPSVAYNAALGVYLMSNWGVSTGAAGEWFAKPSYLGIWVARQPWGPWTQIHEETAWMPEGETMARCFQPQIAPKWIAPDGKSFWLVWTDLQRKGDLALYKKLSEPLSKKSFDDFTPADWALKYELSRQFVPYYSFNTQRVDLTLA